jgi:hypothetical protein
VLVGGFGCGDAELVSSFDGVFVFLCSHENPPDAAVGLVTVSPGDTVDTELAAPAGFSTVLSGRLFDAASLTNIVEHLTAQDEVMYVVSLR